MTESEPRPVLVIGSLNMDLVVQCKHLPNAGQTVFGDDFFTAAGGKGANQAVAAARLDARVSMAGCVGRDQFGQDLTAGLSSAGIDIHCITETDSPTGTALITVDARGANTIVVISGANASFDAGLADSALTRFTSPGILLLQHEIPAEANAHTILKAREAGWFIVLNPAPARPIAGELLPLIDIIAPNETEAAALTGCADANDAAETLLRQGARAVLMTWGAQGALYRDAMISLRCPALRVQAIDTTAAGDAYLGALAAALAEQRALADSLGYAAAAAALAVTRLGAQPSLGTRAEVAAFISRHGQPAAEPV